MCVHRFFACRTTFFGKVLFIILWLSSYLNVVPVTSSHSKFDSCVPCQNARKTPYLSCFFLLQSCELMGFL